MLGTNDLAYFSAKSATKEYSFITLIHGHLPLGLGLEGGLDASEKRIHSTSASSMTSQLISGLKSSISGHRDRTTALEHAPFVVLVYFFPHLNMQKPADYGPQQH